MSISLLCVSSSYTVTSLNIMYIYFVALLVAVVTAAPQRGPEQKPIAITAYSAEGDAENGYKVSFETENGIRSQEVGSLEPADDPKEGNVIVKQGEYSYTSPEGQVIKITFIADKNGFQATGDAIPTPPPIPEPILRALDLIARTAPQDQSVQARPAATAARFPVSSNARRPAFG